MKPLHLISAVGLILLTFFLFLLSKKEEPQVVIGTNLWIGYEPLYVGRYKGLISKEKFKIIQYPSAEDVMRAYMNGIIDVAAVTADEMLKVSSTVPETKAFLVTDISHGGDVIVAKPEFSSIKDLRGKRVAVESGALGAFTLTRALQVHSMKQSDIVPVYRSYHEHVDSYLKNEVDAVVTFEPNRTLLLHEGARELFSSREIPGEIVDLLITRETFLKKRKSDLVELATSWFATLKYIDAEKEECAAFISPRHKISPEEVISSFGGIQLPNKEYSVQLLSRDTLLSRSITNLETILLEASLIKGAVFTPQQLSVEIVESVK